MPQTRGACAACEVIGPTRWSADHDANFCATHYAENVTMTGEAADYYRRLQAARQEAHVYVSTACLHRLHDRCRRTCKWCPSECRCPCHDGPSPSGSPTTEER